MTDYTYSRYSHGTYYIFFLVLFMSLCIGHWSCVTQRNGLYEVDKHAPPPVLPTYRLERTKNKVNFSFVFKEAVDSTSTKYAFIQGLENAQMIIRNEKNELMDSTELGTISAPIFSTDGKDSLEIIYEYTWMNPVAKRFSSIHAEFTVESLGKKYGCKAVQYFSEHDTAVAVPYISVEPFIDEVTDSSITFALLARRNRGAGVDYHPSGEVFRVTIFDSTGKKIFASNTSAMFTTQILPVEPKKNGELYRYTFQWFLRNDSKKKVSPGRYSAELMIVAKPEPYISNVNFVVKGIP